MAKKPAPKTPHPPTGTPGEVTAASALADRFRAATGADAAACWDWPGAPSVQGYGRVCHNRVIRLVHRLSWILYRGGASAGTLCVLHRCDNRRCFNPAHLFLGDRGDNARDMAAKGRQHLQQHPEAALRGDAHPFRQRPELAPRGSAHGCAVLDEAAVLRMRERRRNGEGLGVLAADFGVSKSNVHMICAGLTWRHVGGPISRSNNGARRG